MEGFEMKDETAGIVYKTMDYSKFKRLEANRAVTENRKNKLLASFAEKEIMNPIIVNGNYEVIDGQGRFEAKKELGEPIYYIIDPTATLEDCARMNRFNTSWNVNDFAEAFSKNNPFGNTEPYKILLKTKEDTGLSLARCLLLCGKSGAANNSLLTGKLRFTEDDRLKVLYVNKKATEIKDVLCFSKRLNEAFFQAIAVITRFESYNHKHMLQACAKNRNSYAQMSGVGDMLSEFERIYNKGLKPTNKLFFSDYMRNRGYSVRDYDNSYDSEAEDISSLQ